MRFIKREDAAHGQKDGSALAPSGGTKASSALHNKGKDAALVDGSQPGEQDEVAKFRKMATGYKQYISADQLQLMENQAEAENQNRSRLKEERIHTIHSQALKKVILA